MKRTTAYIMLTTIALTALASRTAHGAIIPSAQPAKEHAAAPDASPVITAEDGIWLLGRPQNNGNTKKHKHKPAAPGFDNASKIIPISDQGLAHGQGAAKSPVINLKDNQWVIEISLDPADDKGMDSVIDPGVPTDNTGSPGSTVPEPATFLLLGLGSLVLRRQRTK